jgi:hypothetical protein
MQATAAMRASDSRGTSIAAAVRRSLWILLMSSRVTGRSLSPMGLEIAGLLPVSTWIFQGSA